MAGADHISEDRLALYQALGRRNGFVSLLRWMVPVIGILVLAILVVQMMLADLTKDFSIGRISIERDKLRVETPSYRGRMDDGSSYEVSAAAAEASIGAMTIIDLTGALVVVDRVGGVQTTATALAAEIESEKQQITIPGVTEISDTSGLTGELSAMYIDFLGQKVSASGPVSIEFAGGETLQSEGMSYDAVKKLWSFSKVTLTFKGVPGDTGGALLPGAPDPLPGQALR